MNNNEFKNKKRLLQVQVLASAGLLLWHLPKEAVKW
jgi:hypothetical protein